MNILGFAGRKRAGKDSSAKFVMGHIMKANNIIEKFDISPTGDLLVNSAYRDENNVLVEDMGIFDVTRADNQFTYFMEEKVWPHVKIYNFADVLKWISISLYGLEHHQVYGSTEDKESPSNISWGQIIDVLPKSIRPSKVDKDLQMTAREFIQRFADVLRWIDDDCLTKFLMQKILMEQCPYAIVADVRRIKEVEAIKAMGGRIIYQTRITDTTDAHHTEHEFDSVDRSIFDAVIDNRVCTIAEKNDIIYGYLKEWGWA